MSPYRIRWAVNIRELENSIYFENFYRLAIQCIPQKDYEEHKRFVYKDDSLACLIGRLIARCFAITVTGNRWNGIEIGRTTKGKPYISHPLTTQQFNISHQGNYVVLASDPEHLIGVDVMHIDQRKDETADEHREKMKRLFSEHELAYMAAEAGEINKWRAFYRIWTLKEAVLKATGEGLINDLRKIDLRIHEQERNFDTSIKLKTRLIRDGQIREEFLFEESMINDNHIVSVATIIPSSDENRDHTTTKTLQFKELNWEEILKEAQVLNPLEDSGIASYLTIMDKLWKPF